jgi:Txe/YoeB family toxin of Txe-Axe toxin-antitoxin module
LIFFFFRKHIFGTILIEINFSLSIQSNENISKKFREKIEIISKVHVDGEGKEEKNEYGQMGLWSNLELR